jgi:hypothetical protein
MTAKLEQTRPTDAYSLAGPVVSCPASLFFAWGHPVVDPIDDDRCGGYRSSHPDTAAGVNGVGRSSRPSKPDRTPQAIVKAGLRLVISTCGCAHVRENIERLRE